MYRAESDVPADQISRRDDLATSNLLEVSAEARAQDQPPRRLARTGSAHQGFSEAPVAAEAFESDSAQEDLPGGPLSASVPDPDSAHEAPPPAKSFKTDSAHEDLPRDAPAAESFKADSAQEDLPRAPIPAKLSDSGSAHEVLSRSTPPAKSFKTDSAHEDFAKPSYDGDIDLERASTASSMNALGDMAGAGQDKHYQPKEDIITRLEHIRQKDMKVPSINQECSP